MTRLMKAIALEDKGHIGSHTRIFTSNLRHDYLLFVSQNSDIKILNLRSGKYIGDIDGAHFKGTYNFGLVVGAGLPHKLKDRMLAIEQEEDKSGEKMMDLIIEQLNDYLLVSCSVKDKLKVWKFDNGLSTPIAQASCIGGTLDRPIQVLHTASKEVCLLVMGNASNKVELFRLK